MSLTLIIALFHFGRCELLNSVINAKNKNCLFLNSIVNGDNSKNKKIICDEYYHASFMLFTKLNLIIRTE